MARSKSDIANSAIRIFLQKVGVFYDEERGLEKFVPTKIQKITLLELFDYVCCYCGRTIDEKTISQDHLIPLNKASLGLHAWGNVVPCCKECNNEKQQKQWKEFLGTKAKGSTYKQREKIIKGFVKKMDYQPNLHIDEFANNLYQDVGEVSMTLIGLRLRQAEDVIKNILNKQ